MFLTQYHKTQNIIAYLAESFLNDYYNDKIANDILKKKYKEFYKLLNFHNGELINVIPNRSLESNIVMKNACLLFMKDKITQQDIDAVKTGIPLLKNYTITAAKKTLELHILLHAKDIL
jgi:thiamine kinase-like enzyme